MSAIKTEITIYQAQTGHSIRSESRNEDGVLIDISFAPLTEKTLVNAYIKARPKAVTIVVEDDLDLSVDLIDTIDALTRLENAISEAWYDVKDLARSLNEAELALSELNPLDQPVRLSEILDLEDLPTWGDRPGDLEPGIYSWDASHDLYVDGSEWSAVKREGR